MAKNLNGKKIIRCSQCDHFKGDPENKGPYFYCEKQPGVMVFASKCPLPNWQEPEKTAADPGAKEWPEVEVAISRDYNGDTYIIEGKGCCLLTRAQAEAVKRAYDETKRQASGKVLYLNLRNQEEVMEHATRILKGLEE